MMVVILLVLIFILILVIGAGGYYLLFLKDRESYEGEEEAVAVVEKAPERKRPARGSPPVYFMEKEFSTYTVNLTSDSDGDRFLQVVLSIEVEHADDINSLNTYAPRIRNSVVLLLTSKKASELITREGKEKLSQEIRLLMNEILNPGSKVTEWPVKDILFTSFIIQ